jgi:hypothetical protein
MIRALPVMGWAGIRLKPVSGLAFRREKGGLLINKRNAEPHWEGQFRSDNLAIGAYADLSTLLTDIVDRNDRIDFVHPRYALPRLYTPATWPLLADPELVSVTNLRTIVVSGLNNGMQLLRGDRLALIQGANELVGYRSIAEDVTVTSTLAQTLVITPRLPFNVFVAGAKVRFKNPAARLAVVPDSWDADEQAGPSPLSFDVTEALA